MKPLILLDRDGVLNDMVYHPEHGTVDSPMHPEQVTLLPGVPEALKLMTDAGFGMAVVTNQPAAAKGKTTRANLEAVHARVLQEATASGGRILSSHVCYHRAEDRCTCRKPATGLLEEAFGQNPDYDRRASWMVGDGVTDIQAGKALGLLTALIGKKPCAVCQNLEDTCGMPTTSTPDLPSFAAMLTRGGPAPMRLRVKVFADGADLAAICRRAADPNIRGFTTNPSLMRKAGVDDYGAFARAALAAVGGRPISFEVIADTEEEIERQALLIHSWGENAYVKIPITNTHGHPLSGLAGRLSQRGVKCNVTAILALDQVCAAATALRGGAPSVVSVFAGRVADAGVDPVVHMRAALAICRSLDPRIELLWASPREVLNIVQANDIGCDIITVTDDLLSKMPNLGKDLTQFSLETVRMLKGDADAGGYTL